MASTPAVSLVVLLDVNVTVKANIAAQAFKNRAAAISNVGYTLSTSQYNDLVQKYKYAYQDLGRIPYSWFDPEIGLNRNLLTYTESPDNAAWTKNRVTINANVITAPNGTLTADEVVTDLTGVASHRITQGFTYETTGVRYIASAYFKKNTAQYAVVQTYAEATSRYIKFNLNTGVVEDSTFVGSGNTYGIIDVGNGWYRCWINVGVGTPSSNIVEFCTCEPNGATYTYTGTNKGIYMWGMMVEKTNSSSSVPSDYNPRLDNTIVKPLNQGTVGVGGDGTFTGTGASSATMQDFSGSRRVFKAVQASLQYINTPIQGVSGASKRFAFGFVNRTSNNASVLMGYGASGTDRFLIRHYNGGNITTSVDNFGPNTSTTPPAIGTWYGICGQYDGLNASAYLNGGSKGNATGTANSTSTTLVILQGLGTYLDGYATHLIYDTNSYTDAQILAFNNHLKADVGL